jgi:hypothetical protein
MNFNNEAKHNNTSALVTPMSSTNSPSTSELLTAMSQQVLSLYQQLKGVLMKTINGKLVSPNSIKSPKLGSEFDFFFTDNGDSETPLNEIQEVRLSLQLLEQKLTNLETDKIVQINRQVNQIKTQMSQRLIALTAASAIGFIGLGIWIGVKVNPSTSEVNYPTSIESLE